jgi:L-ascorbate metabolism protein UlaG (beta-lactamase superfamily)
MAESSMNATLIAPKFLHPALRELGINDERIITACNKWHILNKNLSFRTVPAAHPEIERDSDGNNRYVGYLLKFDNRILYHSGDTSIRGEIIKDLMTDAPIDIALVSVNEKNYYKDEKGIIGNMTIREAFQLSEDIGASTFVPMHWDMFVNNYVYREEIELLYNKISPKFIMKINPDEL